MSIFGNETEIETKEDKRAKLSDEDRDRLSDIEAGPADMSLEILKNVDYKTLLMYCQVSQTVRRLCKTEPMRKLKAKLGAQVVLERFIKYIIVDAPYLTELIINFIPEHKEQMIGAQYTAFHTEEIVKTWISSSLDMKKAINAKYGTSGHKLLKTLLQAKENPRARIVEKEADRFALMVKIPDHSLVLNVLRTLSLVPGHPDVKVRMEWPSKSDVKTPNEMLDVCLSKFKHLHLIKDKFEDWDIENKSVTFKINLDTWADNFIST